MDEELYRKKLSEVANWRIPKTLALSVEGIAKKPKGKKTNEDRYQEQHEQVFNEMFDGVNPTFPIHLDEIKRKDSACSDCGITCEEDRQQDYKWFQGKEKNSWRIRCNICKMYKNPYTGLYDLDSTKAQGAINSYINGIEHSVHARIHTDKQQEE